MTKMISIELYKIFRKWRTYIGFIATGVLVPLIHLSFYLTVDEGEMIPNRIQDMFVVSGNLGNGYFISFLILQSLFIHIPFLVILIGGDLLAGEATSGTYRMLITRPISRFQILTSKFIAGMIATTALLVWLALLSLIIGLLIFGSGVLIIMGNPIRIFAENDVLWRFFAAYGIGSLSMFVVVALAFLFSSLVENAIGPIVSTMAIIIVFMIISVIPVDFFQAIKPYLFTNYLTGYNLFFDDPVNTNAIVNIVLILTAHVLGFYLISLYIFTKKDILS